MRDGAAKTRQIHFDRRRCRYTYNNTTEFYVYIYAVTIYIYILFKYPTGYRLESCWKTNLKKYAKPAHLCITYLQREWLIQRVYSDVFANVWVFKKILFILFKHTKKRAKRRSYQYIIYIFNRDSHDIIMF